MGSLFFIVLPPSATNTDWCSLVTFLGNLFITLSGGFRNTTLHSLHPSTDCKPEWLFSAIFFWALLDAVFGWMWGSSEAFAVPWLSQGNRISLGIPYDPPFHSSDPKGIWYCVLFFFPPPLNQKCSHFLLRWVLTVEFSVCLDLDFEIFRLSWSSLGL